jgi:hypothetical protein
VVNTSLLDCPIAGGLGSRSCCVMNGEVVVDDGHWLEDGRRTYMMRPATVAITTASAHRGQNAATAAAAAAAATAAAEQDEEMQAATQSTLLELLSNPALHPSSVTRFLNVFPVPKGMPPGKRLLLARQCWEHLLDNRDTHRMEYVYGKMELLRRTKLYCPTELFRQHCQLEQVQLLVDAMESQVKVGTFLAHLRCSLSADGQHTFRPESHKMQQLQVKLEAADLLMVVHTLGAVSVFSIDAQQLQQLQLVHLARHGPLTELESLLRTLGARRQHQQQTEGSSAAAPPPQAVCDMLDSLHQGFPILYQPLIECHAGWLDRLSVLLRAGADAATVYEPWNCSALHMLFYRKSAAGSSSRKIPEATQVQALQLLLQHGAKAVLNLADKGSAGSDEARSSTAPTQRTALLQAASAGRFQACRALLTAGAEADGVDSSNQSMLDYLFYLKHSNWGVHRRATAGYTCMQLYGLVIEFDLHALVSDELEQDCQSCGRCRFLLASCSNCHEQDATSTSESSSCTESEDSTSRNSSSHSGMEDHREQNDAVTAELAQVASAAAAAPAWEGASVIVIDD